MQSEECTRQNILKRLKLTPCQDTIKIKKNFYEIAKEITNIQDLTEKRWDNIDSIIVKFYILIAILIGLQALSIMICCIFIS